MEDFKNTGDLYYTSLPVFAGGLQICDLGFAANERGHTWGPAVRDYWLVHFALGGRGKFYVKDKTFSIGAGECFLIKPDEVTTYAADEADPWRYFWIGVRGAEGGSLVLKAFGDRLVSGFDLSLENEIKNLFGGAYAGFNLGLQAAAVFFRLLSSVFKAGGTPEKNKPDIVCEAVKIIENGYFRQFDVASLAKGLGMSRAHFTSVFTAAMGVSPYRYLTSCRLQKAAELLLRTPYLTVEEIAYSAGYSSVERFSAMFKSKFGLSPLNYRNSGKG